MTEKFSVLIKYKYLEFIENAKLSDADAWAFMKGLIEYDKTGKEPRFRKQILTGMFTVLKSDLDENRVKWEEKVATNRANGKKGGRPPKTQTTQDNPTEPKEPIGFSETQHNPKNPEKADSGGDLDSGIDLDNEFIHESCGGNSSPEKTKIPRPPPSIEQIKKESEAQGFFIDSSIAMKFQDCGIDPSWLLGPHSFLKFCSWKVRMKYPEKEGDALKPLFITAVKSWEDLREEYPHWLGQKEKEDADRARRKASDKAMAAVPKECPVCGAPLNYEQRCPNKHGVYRFQDDVLEYKFLDTTKDDGNNLTSEFQSRMKAKFGEKGEK
jgi:hypothetical protein